MGRSGAYKGNRAMLQRRNIASATPPISRKPIITPKDQVVREINRRLNRLVP